MAKKPTTDARRSDRSERSSRSVLPSPVPVPSAEPEPERTPEKETAIDSRLSIPLDKEGNPLIDNMRESSRKKLRELLPSVSRSLGGEPAAALSLPAEFMYPLISGLSMIETLIIASTTKAPREIVERIAPYSREEAQQLAPLVAKVLSKHTGTVFEKWGDELTLAFLLVTMTTAKISAVREELAKLPAPRPLQFPTPATPEPSEPVQ